ncbi:unnamed protein product [Lymnaea stagnalis]|uniref:CARD domain-containing protein n=1 Tax=Lymnaea stagnalis TaxID=6523 RepID=A0AAV2I4J1_LYMST
MSEQKRISHGRLQPNHEQAIMMQYMYLKEELEAKYIVDSLLTHRVLDQDDKDEVLSARTRKDRTEILLNKILHAGPGDAFTIFLEALESNKYEHIAQKLKEHIYSTQHIGNVKPSLL